MAEIRVLKNESGKVLRNTAGKILKANHSFGYGYDGAARVNFNPALTYRETTVIFWTAKSKLGNYHQLYYTGGAVAATTAMLNTATSLYTQFAGSTQLYSGAIAGRIFHATRISATQAIHLGNMAGQSYAPADIATRADLSYAIITAGIGLTDYYAFDRYLSDAEINHVYNSLIGNTPITLGGCIVAAEFEKAEVLDCSFLV